MYVYYMGYEFDINLSYEKFGRIKNITVFHRSAPRDGLEDPLDDVGTVQQQLEQLSVIGRCSYGKTCALLVAHFDRAAAAYSRETQPQPTAVLQGEYCPASGLTLTYALLLPKPDNQLKRWS